MINLGGDEEIMLRYKVIERTDLKMSADVDTSTVPLRSGDQQQNTVSVNFARW